MPCAPTKLYVYRLMETGGKRHYDEHHSSTRTFSEFRRHIKQFPVHNNRFSWDVSEYTKKIKIG
jgi:hypothetical protein